MTREERCVVCVVRVLLQLLYRLGVPIVVNVCMVCACVDAASWHWHVDAATMMQAATYITVLNMALVCLLAMSFMGACASA